MEAAHRVFSAKVLSLVAGVLCASPVGGVAVAQQAQPAITAATATAAPTAEEQGRAAGWANLAKYREADRALLAAGKSSPDVVFFGDSLTERWGQKDASGVSPTGDYLASHGYVNRGISGQTTPQMLARFRQDVLELKPKVLVLLAGSNDIAGNIGPMTLEETEANLTTMIELAQVHRISVILCALPPASELWWNPTLRPAANIVTLNGWIRQFALDHHLPYVNYYPALTDGKGGMKPEYSDDKVHPNKLGYDRMEPLVEPAIEAALKQRR